MMIEITMAISIVRLHCEILLKCLDCNRAEVVDIEEQSV